MNVTGPESASIQTHAQRLLGANVCAVSRAEAVQLILEWAAHPFSKSVFFADAHMLTRVHSCTLYGRVINNGDLVCPDGMPVAWLLRRLGVVSQQQVAGPDVMLDVCTEAAKRGVPVGLLGSTDDMLCALQSELKKALPELHIAFCHSPPFREFTDEEDLSIVTNLTQSGARIVFVALGCPRQEKWIEAHVGKVPAVMLGVGWAFAVHAKRSRRAPGWMRSAGLETLHQILLHPQQYLRRYLKVVPKFCLLVAASLVGLRDIRDARWKSSSRTN